MSSNEIEKHDAKDTDSTEGQKKKLKYPRSIPFIIGNEFCERFNYYGLRTILVLYLNRELQYSKNDSTIIYHIFTMMVYFLCVPGAIIADSWLGKFKTILTLSCVYVVGSVLISVTAIQELGLPAVALTMTGLSLVALGSGGIKPCVAAFGGDQFKLPEQAKQAAMFFSLFYFSINSGSLVSTTITPILREEVHCFGQASCYPLAFGIPAVLMCISIVIFIAGRPLFVSKPPAGNMLLMVTKTIGAAISGRYRESKTNPRDHWLDYAESKYDKQLIDDVKVLLRVLLLYIPLPVFWALFDQQGSRWTFQATRMEGVLGTINIKPEQMQLINPLLILTFIPLYEAVFYPLMAKCGIRRPLQKLFCGGLLAGIAFTISGIVELELEKTYPVFPGDSQGELRVFNGFPSCSYEFTTNITDHPTFDIKGVDMFALKEIDVSKTANFSWSALSSGTSCPELKNESFYLNKKAARSFFLQKSSSGEATILSYDESIDKPLKGNPEFRIIANLVKPANIVLKDSERDNKVGYDRPHTNRTIAEIIMSTYDIYINDKNIKSGIELKQGGVYTILIGETSSGSYEVTSFDIVKPNSLHILWLIPQYVIMTLGEVMYSVTGLEFSYSQAPKSMKSVLQACWLLTIAVGNVVVVIIAEAKLFNSQAYEFFLFAGLMFVDMLFFSFLAYRYKPNIVKHDSDDDSDETVPIVSNDQSTRKIDDGKVNKAFDDDESSSRPTESTKPEDGGNEKKDEINKDKKSKEEMASDSATDNLNNDDDKNKTSNKD